MNPERRLLVVAGENKLSADQENESPLFIYISGIATCQAISKPETLWKVTFALFLVLEGFV
jgi:hypothetical protein